MVPQPWSKNNPLFKFLTEEVSQARRESDADPDLEIRGEMLKLIGNPFYRKQGDNKENCENTNFKGDIK